MPMYNLVEYSDNYSKTSGSRFANCKSEINNAEIDNYSKTSGSLWQYYKDEQNDNLADSESFKSKVKITGNTPDDGNTKDVEIIVPLRDLNNFWRTLEMPLINCKVNLVSTWSSTCVITNSTGTGRFFNS